MSSQDMTDWGRSMASWLEAVGDWLSFADNAKWNKLGLTIDATHVTGGAMWLSWTPQLNGAKQRKPSNGQMVKWPTTGFGTNAGAMVAVEAMPAATQEREWPDSGCF